MARKPKVNRERLVQLLHEGKDTYEIAKELSVTPTTVKYWMRKLDLSYRRKRTWKLSENPELKQKLIRYFNEGVSMNEIAKRLEVTSKAVKYWVKKLGLRRKPSRLIIWRCPICGELLWGRNPKFHLEFVHGVSEEAA